MCAAPVGAGVGLAMRPRVPAASPRSAFASACMVWAAQGQGASMPTCMHAPADPVQAWPTPGPSSAPSTWTRPSQRGGRAQGNFSAKLCLWTGGAGPGGLRRAAPGAGLRRRTGRRPARAGPGGGRCRRLGTTCRGVRLAVRVALGFPAASGRTPPPAPPRRVMLDGVVTVVDSVNIGRHLDKVGTGLVVVACGSWGGRLAGPRASPCARQGRVGRRRLRRGSHCSAGAGGRGSRLPWVAQARPGLFPANPVPPINGQFSFQCRSARRGTTTPSTRRSSRWPTRTA